MKRTRAANIADTLMKIQEEHGSQEKRFTKNQLRVIIDNVTVKGKGFHGHMGIEDYHELGALADFIKRHGLELPPMHTANVVLHTAFCSVLPVSLPEIIEDEQSALLEREKPEKLVEARKATHKFSLAENETERFTLNTAVQKATKYKLGGGLKEKEIREAMLRGVEDYREMQANALGQKYERRFSGELRGKSSGRDEPPRLSVAHTNS